MRSLPLRAALLAPIATLAACSAPEPGVEIVPAEPGSGTATASPSTHEPSPSPSAAEPSSPPATDPSSAPEPTGTPFGESVAVPFPVGAYEHEFDGTADVLYTVGDVAATAPGTVGFTLTVEIPELGRVFGMGNMTVTCDAGGGRVAAATGDGLGEAEAGTHTFAMECPVPGDTGELLVAIEHHDERLEFTGIPD
ncbi:hypothetical protein [Nocardiopsis sp. CC223A]|uniref:hypothetical protein n=1 Tax=Nocardiopsis sp. CC223A TaxID=3044051 RepID=UPI00278C411E|nr:hypothetical protein [Nocardiopsis sp. CC223A]